MEVGESGVYRAVNLVTTGTDGWAYRGQEALGPRFELLSHCRDRLAGKITGCSLPANVNRGNCLMIWVEKKNRDTVSGQHANSDPWPVGDHGITRRF